jgi:hypothetical protein
MEVMSLKVTLIIPKCWMFKLLNQLVDLNEILYGVGDIEGGLDVMSSKPIASAIPK